MSSGCPLQCALEILRPLASRDEACEPRAVRMGQDFTGLVPVPLVGVDAADNDGVPEHRFRPRHRRWRARRYSAGPDAGEAHEPPARPPAISLMTCPTPVHSTTMSGWNPSPRRYHCGMSRRGHARGPAWAPIRPGRGRGLPARAAFRRGPREGRSAPPRSRAPSGGPRRHVGRPLRPAPTPSRPRSWARAARPADRAISRSSWRTRAPSASVRT